MEKILPLDFHLHEFQLIEFLNEHSKNKQQ